MPKERAIKMEMVRKQLTVLDETYFRTAEEE